MLKYFIKFLISAILVTWLFQRGLIDIEYVKEIISNTQILGLCLLIFLFQAILSSLRFLFILKSSHIHSISFFKALCLNQVGLFFNTFLPGSVSGDFFKAYYLKDHAETDYQKSIILSLSDRIIGLAGLLLLIFLGSIYLNYNTTVNVELIFYSMSAVIFFSIVGLLILVKYKAFFRLHFKSKKSDSPLKTKIRLALKTLLNVIARPRILLVNISISLFIQIANVAIFYLLNKAIFPDSFNPLLLISIVPIASFVSGLPLSFSGIGVTHVALQGLLSQYGVNDGANMFNAYLIVMIIYNFFGIFPFIFLKKEK